jgi:hypothetical protein
MKLHRVHRRLVIVFGALCAALSIIAVVWLILFRGWNAAELERLIRLEVSEGSDRNRVELWFEKHGIPCAYFEGPDHARFNASIATEIGLEPSEISGVLQGCVDMHQSRAHILLPSEIFVYFFFDKKGRLIGHFVASAVYGP